MVPWAAMIVFGLRCWTCVFFTTGILFGFGRGFGTFDTLLNFLLQNLFEEVSSLNKEKVVKVVEGLSKGGVVHHLIAFGQRTSRRSARIAQTSAAEGLDFMGTSL